MSNARKRRKTIKWARYFNRYCVRGQFGRVRIGGDALVREIWGGRSRMSTWSHIRRQGPL